MKELIIVRGLPGSGKSTFGKLLGGIQYEADMYFIDHNGRYNFNPMKIKEAHKWCKTKVEMAMLDEVSRIVVSNTFTEEWEMEDYIKLAKVNNYKVFTVISENRHESESIHSVPSETISKMRNRFSIKL